MCSTTSNLTETAQEVIDEFPQFSFLLSDNHPHVLALPFAVLALGLALNTLLLKRRPNSLRNRLLQRLFWRADLSQYLGWPGLPDRAGRGGGAAPPDCTTVACAIVIWVDLLAVWRELLVLAALFYLPFLVAFRSQFSGILPNLQYPTLFQQYFMMFGPLLLLLSSFMGVEVWRAGRRMNWRLACRSGCWCWAACSP